MKQTIILISMLWTLSASAQFHTIGRGYSIIEKTTSKPDTAVITKVEPPEDRGKTIQSDFDSFENNWIHPPLKGRPHITSHFGHRRNPFGKKQTEFHSGIDLSAKAGTPIYAILPGEVAHIGYDSRSGNYIKLRHGNFTVSYCHLIRKPNIPVGSKVLPGQPVAHVGSTGRSTGPHLHITLKRNGRAIDPAILLNITNEHPNNRIRLLYP